MVEPSAEVVEFARWTYEALARVMAPHGRALEGQAKLEAPLGVVAAAGVRG